MCAVRGRPLNVFNKGPFFLLTPVSTRKHNGPVKCAVVTIVFHMNANYSAPIRDDCIISPHVWNVPK